MQVGARRKKMVKEKRGEQQSRRQEENGAEFNVMCHHVVKRS